MAKSDEINFQAQAIHDLIAGTAADQMDNQTPCAKWKTRDLLNHLVGGGTMLGAMLKGEAPTIDPEADLIGDDPIGAWDAAIAAFREGVDSEGAMEREVMLPDGPVPGAVLLDIIKFDTLVHAWDLAKATGQDFDPPAEIMDPAIASARQLLTPELRDGDRFAAEVTSPSGASQIEQLAAFTGRTV